MIMGNSAEELHYAVAKLLDEYSMSDLLEILAEHCGLLSEELSEDSGKFIQAMNGLFEIAKLLRANTAVANQS